MSFDWSEYFFLAQELAGHPTDRAGQEARLRAAISRAYYATFCSARNLLRDKDSIAIPRNKNPHEFVISRFRKNQHPLRRKIGDDLDRLRRRRNKADYEDTILDIHRIAETALRLAQRTLSTLNQL